MSIFDLRHLIIEEYGKYVQSFFSIADEMVREFIKEEVLIKRTIWPAPLLQPSIQMRSGVDCNEMILRIKSYNSRSEPQILDDFKDDPPIEI